jgi:hypothetical protein
MTFVRAPQVICLGDIEFFDSCASRFQHFVMVFVQVLGHLSGYYSNCNHTFGALRVVLQMVAQKVALAADNGQFIDKIA